MLYKIKDYIQDLQKRECVLEQPKLAEELYAKAQTHKCKFQKIPLKCGKKKGRFKVNLRWA
jgi:hypothetical protein